MPAFWPYARHAWLRLALIVALLVLVAHAVAKAGETANYPFQTRPLTMLARLDELRKLQAADLGTPAGPTLCQEALELLQKIDAGDSLNEQDLATAALIASGVNDSLELTRYRKQLDDLTAAAREAIAEAKTPAQRGEALLKFLHGGLLKNGYDAEQSSLAEIFESGKYNCISATVAYQLVGRRLGLELRGVSIPGGFFVAGHAMTMLVEKDRRIDVETTNAAGFDFQDRLQKSGGSVVGPRTDLKDGHDVSDLGLASLIAQNRVLSLQKAKRPVDAIQTALVGLALDPIENARANNFMAVTSKWALAMCESGKFEDSLTVLDFAHAVLPNDRDLATNRAFVWQKYATAELKAGRERECLAVLRRAAKAMPEGRFVRLQAELLIHAALDLKNAGKWREGVALLERGLALVDAGPADEVRLWIIQIYSGRAEAELETGRLDAALTIYAEAWKKWSTHRDLKDAIAYFAQQSLPKKVEAGGPAEAAAWLTRLRQEFPTVDALQTEGQECAERAIFKLADEGKFTEAVAASDVYTPLANGPEGKQRLGEIAYCRWAESLLEKKDWAGSLEIYTTALKKLPGSRRLADNAVAAWNRQAREAIDAKDWETAIRTYERALEQFSSDSLLKNNLAYCQEQQARTKR